MTNPIFSHRYHLIVGFTGQSTLPDVVIHDLIKVMKNFTVNQGRDIWPVITKTLTCAEDLLRHSTVTVIFKDNGTVVCRNIGLHNPPSKVMGVDHFFCGGLGCRALPGELRYSNKLDSNFMKETVRQECSQCKFRSRNVKVGDVDWAHSLPGNRRIFWHNYPPTDQQRALFVDGPHQSIVPAVKRAWADSMNAAEGARKKRM